MDRTHFLRIISIIMLSATLIHLRSASSSAWEFNLDGSLGPISGRSVRMLQDPARYNRTLTSHVNGQMTDVQDSAVRTLIDYKASDDEASQNAFLTLCPRIKFNVCSRYI